ncbi:MAG: N-acetylmuramoyl-L-alanine amidase, partial [Actinobacteria bacterium]|nr:N-acetylmuramoyl-L-alanine amidase [Actinomycetota bacterium]
TINLAVVHHTESGNDYTPAQVPGIIRSVQAYHMQGRGWSDIGYNFVVDKFGTVWEGRAGSIAGPTIGAHTAGFNTNSVGVVVIGSYVGVQPSAASMESVSQVIGWKLASYGVNPNTSVTRVAGDGSSKYPVGTTITIPRVVGHGDIGSTSCPGSISGQLPWIRQRSQQWAELAWASSTPVGSVDAYGVAPGTVVVAGWAADADATAPVTVRVVAGGVSATTTTGLARPDVAAAVSFAGPTAGFQGAVSGVPPGYQDVCVTAVNQNYGTGDVLLGCRPVIVPDPTGRAPSGTVDAATGFVGGFDVEGTFAIPAPGSVTSIGIEVDGGVVTWVAPVGSRFSAHVVGVVAGTHKVCGVALTSFGTLTRVNCRLVAVTGASAIGSVDVIRVADDRILVAGWALDPESLGAIPVAVSIDGRKQTLLAADPRGDVAAAHPGYGPNHGFSMSSTAGVGSHSVCVEFGGVGAGPNVLARCERVVVK